MATMRQKGGYVREKGQLKEKLRCCNAAVVTFSVFLLRLADALVVGLTVRKHGL